MKKRILTAAIALALFIPFLIFYKTVFFTAMLTVVCLVAAYEILNCTGFKKNIVPSVLTYIFSAAVPLIAGFCTGEEFYRYFVPAFFIFTFLMFAAAVFSHGKLKITDICVDTLFGVYAVFGLSSLLLIRNIENGAYIYLIAFICPWLCDTFAYFGGMLLGKHKLIPDVSPKKTVEGAVCGVVFGTAGVLLYGFIVSKIYGVVPNYAVLAVLGLFLTVISQIGDLVASVVKRNYGIKDYGFIFPGHGGIIDRFDSVISTSAFLYLFCEFSGEMFKLFS